MAGTDAPDLVPYQWCVLQVVPRVDRGEVLNAGVVVLCPAHGVLAAAVALDVERAVAFWPGLDVPAVERHLDAAVQVCAGTHPAMTGLPPGQRFRWLTAPRSTVVQTSPVHTGLTADPAGQLQRLLTRMVLVPGPGPAQG